jgi:hypothetical protein
MGVYTLNIVGESFKKEIKLCREGEGLILKREPDNKYDRNAVAVLRENGGPIGYLSRDDAEWIGRIMDEGGRVDAKIKRITGGERDKPSYGVVIYVNTTSEAGWEEDKRKGSVVYVKDGEKCKDEVTSGEREKKEKKTQKGFWKKIFGG